MFFYKVPHPFPSWFSSVIMKSRFLWVVGLPSLLVIFIFLDGCNGVRHHCPPSSCGTLRNIKSPFGLNTTDPNECGEFKFQLHCENNRTLWHLNSTIYYVEEISYKKQVIRVVDSGLQKDNCSSLPLNSDPAFGNLSIDADFPDLYFMPTTMVILFVKCSVPMTSSFYTAATCFNTFIQDYLYVTHPGLKMSDLNTSCKIVMKVPVLPLLLPGTQEHNYSKIHDRLLKGFELCWKIPIYFSWKYYDNLGLQLISQIIWWKTLMLYCKTPFQSSECFSKFMKFPVYALPVDMLYAIKYLCEVLLPIRTLIGVFCLAIFLACKLRTRHIWMDATVEEFLTKHRYQTPTRYSYSDIKKMTKGLKEKLGQGGFGTVFKGKLRSGRLVAVKMLAKAKGNGQDFINEIATIGRIHHVNVVQLIGFCSEGSKRALIYDYMPNGSLEKYIFSQQGNINPLSWEKTYQITLGIARGIEYLHRGCDMRILHFDIKPHNILLDENYVPKVSDFGLAKFYPTEESAVLVTAPRGTIGYMAPELIYKNLGGVSYKSDVYSFGMLLMEMAGRRRNVNPMAENSSQIYYPSWIYDQVIQGNDMGLGNATEDEKEMAKKFIIVALWCIQMKPTDRPSMGKVLEMLEGSLELLQIPPKPFLSSPTRVTNENDASQMDSMGSSTTISEYGLVLQDHTESNPLHVIVD